MSKGVDDKSALSADALERLKPSVHGLARALSRNAPQPEWPVSTHRERYENAAATRPLADGVNVETTEIGGLAAEWVIPSGPRSEQVIAYLHGGGFIMGSLATTRPLASQLAALTGRRVIVPDYPLAPEFTFPSQHKAIVTALRELAQAHELQQGLVLAGDSAGGALVLNVVRELRERTDPRVAAVVLLSPLLDLRLAASSIDANAPYDPQLPRWLAEHMATTYLNGHDPADSDASAVLGPLDDLPPTLVQASPDESLADDARLLTDRARHLQTPVELQWWDGMLHVWHAFAPRLPEAVEALNAVGTFLDDIAA